MRDRLRSSRAQMITILIFEASATAFLVGDASTRRDPAARRASHRPQPKMQLALALAKRAAIRTQSAKHDLRRAVQLLNDVAMTPCNGAYDGIAMIALMEAAARVKPIDRMDRPYLGLGCR